MKNIFILICFVLITAKGFAQEQNDSYRWVIKAGGSAITNENGYSSTLTAGYVLADNSKCQLGLHLDYSFLAKKNDRQLVALNFTVSDNFDSKFFINSSIGLGVLTNSFGYIKDKDENQFCDLAVPIILETGYAITDRFSIGIALNNYLNCMNLKERSQYSSGVFISFKF